MYPRRSRIEGDDNLKDEETDGRAWMSCNRLSDGAPESATHRHDPDDGVAAWLVAVMSASTSFINMTSGPGRPDHSVDQRRVQLHPTSLCLT